MATSIIPNTLSTRVTSSNKIVSNACRLFSIGKLRILCIMGQTCAQLYGLTLDAADRPKTNIVMVGYIPRSGGLLNAARFCRLTLSSSTGTFSDIRFWGGTYNDSNTGASIAPTADQSPIYVGTMAWEVA